MLQDRGINHSKGSHGVPGIFVKYDLSPLKVTVLEQHKPYWQFLVRLCGIIGGIFATSGKNHYIIIFIPLSLNQFCRKSNHELCVVSLTVNVPVCD